MTLRGIGIFGVISIVLCEAILSFCLAAETRGLRVVAKETATGETKEVKLYNKSYAVIIGIDQYQNLSASEQLTYAVHDAKGVEEVLRKNFKFDKIITLYNKQATKDNILKVLMEDLRNEMTEEDSLFVFWAGHGNQETTRTGDIGYLVPYDGNIKKLQSNISMNALKDDISKGLPAKHVFYVMDACYSGLLTATRALEKENRRDFSYLQEITKEPVRQVLTAGGKNQKVLDGGPNGHSVFTGRMIELLENAEDFITANELQAKVTEKVFSDARSMGANQTPVYGKLYGVGDFVFVPSLEHKVEDTQGKIDAYQAEIDKLNKMEKDAAKAQNDQQRRKVEIEKRQVEAKIAAEKLRQQTLEEQRKKRESELREDERRQVEAGRQKKENDQRIAQLSKDVAEKRKSLEGAALSSISPQKTLDEMQGIDRKIKQIREQFRNELKNGILQVVNRINHRHLKLADAKKDEFESEPEFHARIAKEKIALNSEQSAEFSAVQNRLLNEYNLQIAPFIEELKKLSGQEFTITAENLIIELGKYDGASNTYPITIRGNKPLEIVVGEGKKKTRQVQFVPAPAPSPPAKKGKKSSVHAQMAPVTKTVIEQIPTKIEYIWIVASAYIPLPRDEARDFKLHFQNNMLRAEMKGYFNSDKNFNVIETQVIDDATSKPYKLSSARFTELENGMVYDSVSKITWSENAKLFTPTSDFNDAEQLCRNFELGNIRGWRLPAPDEFSAMYTVYNNGEKNPFKNVQGGNWNGVHDHINQGYFVSTGQCISLKDRKVTDCDHFNYGAQNIWCVLGGEIIKKGVVTINDATIDKYNLFTSKFIVLNNSLVYDSITKIIWTINARTYKDIYKYEDAYRICNSFINTNISGWRLPSTVELLRMSSVYRGHETHPFINIQGGRTTDGLSTFVADGYFSDLGDNCISIVHNKIDRCSDSGNNVWCVR